MTELRIATTPDDAGQRLDRVLRQAAPELSRAALQKAVQAGRCQVDGLPETRADAKIRAGQTIVLSLPETSTTLQAEEGHLELLWQDEHMNGIIGLTHLALQSNPSDDQKNYLQKIRSSATNLLAIINDILDLSKIEANKMLLENTNYPLEDVLEFVHTSLRFPIEQKGLEYICRVGDEVPLKLWGDSLRLKQVLLNLMSNAVKFTAEGRISLCIDRETAGDTDNLHFRITDTGMGISREYQQFLFDPYTQANASISRRFGGTGLGLSICKRIAELMHGSLWCESELGKGSTFHLSIPCTPARNVYCPPEHTTSIPM